MGPAATTTAYTPPVPRRLIIGSRPGASRTPAAPAPLARLRPVLDPARPLTRDRQLSGNRARQAPGKPAGQPGMPATGGKPDKRLHTGRLTRPRSFRDDIVAH